MLPRGTNRARRGNMATRGRGGPPYSQQRCPAPQMPSGFSAAGGNSQGKPPPSQYQSQSPNVVKQQPSPAVKQEPPSSVKQPSPAVKQETLSPVKQPSPAVKQEPSAIIKEEPLKEIKDEKVQSASPQTKAAVKQFPGQPGSSPQTTGVSSPKAGSQPKNPPAPKTPAAQQVTPRPASNVGSGPASQPKAAAPSPSIIKQLDNTKENVEPRDQSEKTNGNTDKVAQDEETPMEVTDENAKKKKNRKRRSAGAGAQPVSKRYALDPVSGHKNSLMALNEIKPGLKYSVDSMEGPPHNPKFTVSVEIDNQKYTGTGRSKQEAKHAAAQSALVSFVQLRNPLPVALTNHDFTSDAVEAPRERFVETALVFSSPLKRLNKMLQTGENKNPVMLLNELHPGLDYSLVSENSMSSAMRFTISVKVNEQLFEGSGQSKKQAKAAAARAVLASLYGVPSIFTTGNSVPDRETADHLEPFPQHLADRIAEATFAKYSEVMEDQDETHKKWKVLASICMTDDEAMEHVTVISLSTGTKCINGEHISMNGAALNDCHAEILARRCFKDFLYTQLEWQSNSERSSESILEPLPSGGFWLKKNVKFHLFINTAPCGDARIFSPHEPTTPDSLFDKHPNRRIRGLLRSKIEAGEGTIPVKPHEAYQTYDAIQGGQRLLTMSCSDKLARWNILGLQGALLCHFIEPIYLESLVLGSLFNPNHMYRAMGGRIQKFLGNLPEPYKFHIPKMCMTSSMEARQPSKSPNHSMNWRIGQTVEIVNASTGKLYVNQCSRLVRRQLFTRFSYLKDKLPMLSKIQEKNATMYTKAKAQAKDYEAAKDIVLQAFKKAGLGCWVRKPDELGEFDYFVK